MEKENSHHIIPFLTYMKVFGALMFLTVITVLAAKIDLTLFLGEGPWNVILAMLIASIKAILVLMFFMHLYYDKKTNALFFMGSMLFVVIFIVFVYFDIAYRDGINDLGKENPLGKSAFQSLNDDTELKTNYKSNY